MAALQSSYNEAVALKDNRERYELLTRQNNFELLQKALASGLNQFIIEQQAAFPNATGDFSRLLHHVYERR